MIFELSTICAFTAIILTIPVKADWNNCTAVDFATFEAERDQAYTPVLGPQGLYSEMTVDKACLYVDAGPDGSLATTNPDLHAGIIEFAQKQDQVSFDFLQPVSKAPQNIVKNSLENRQVFCGDICGGSSAGSQRCLQCACKWSSGGCFGTTCWSIWKCL